MQGLYTGMGVLTYNIAINARPTYEEAAAFLPPTIKVWTIERKFRAIRSQSNKPYLVVDGYSFVTSDSGFASLDEITDVVFVDGVQMKGEEVKKKVRKSSIKGVGAMGKEIAIKCLGIKKGVLQLYINTLPGGEINPHALLEQRKNEDKGLVLVKQYR